jgi:hypothetical protein
VPRIGFGGGYLPHLTFEIPFMLSPPAILWGLRFFCKVANLSLGKGCASKFQSLNYTDKNHLQNKFLRLGNPKTIVVTGDMYSFMITKYAVPAVTKLYGQRVVWQDDPAMIHPTKAALEAFSAFSSRIPYEEQAPKLTGIWPV